MIDTYSLRPAPSPPVPAIPHAGPVFVSGPGTDAGKTIVSLALVAHARRRGHRMIALKPLETGCTPRPQDADRLARAAGDPSLADDSSFYRVAPALGPAAVTLRGAAPPPDLARLVRACRTRLAPGGPGLVEGAGGLMVPLDGDTLIADLVGALGFPLVLVAANRLGVQSDVLAISECAAHRGLPMLAVVLNRVSNASDASLVDNREVLAERLPCPVVEFPHLPGDPTPDQLAAHLDPRLLAQLAW